MRLAFRLNEFCCGRIATLRECERAESAVFSVRHFRERRLYGPFRGGTIPIKGLTHTRVGLQTGRELFHAGGVRSGFGLSEPLLCRRHLAEKPYRCRLSCKEERR